MTGEIPENGKRFIGAVIPVEPLKRGYLNDMYGLPIDPTLFEQVPFQVVMNRDSEVETLSNYHLQIPSRHHGRAYDMRFHPEAKPGTEVCTPQFYFGDEFGNTYSSLGTKGNNALKIHVLPSSIEPSGLRIHGLQDASLIDRVTHISQTMRDSGIDTEWIVAARQPSQYPLRSYHDARQVLIHPELEDTDAMVSLYSLRQLKRTLDVENELRVRRAQSSRSSRDEPIPLDALDDVQFVVTYRALKTPYRLVDIEEAPRRANQIMAGIITIHNLDEARQARQDPDYQPKILDKTPEAYHEFICDVLPKNIGVNLAKLHNLGMWHKYLHPGNISLLGGIYDTDSVRYAAAFEGDEELDIDRALGDIQYFSSSDNFAWFDKLYGVLFGDEDGSGSMKNSDRFLNNLYDAYLEQRDFDDRPEYAFVFRGTQETDTTHFQDTDTLRSWLPPELQAVIDDNLDEFKRNLVTTHRIFSNHPQLYGIPAGEGVMNFVIGNEKAVLWEQKLHPACGQYINNLLDQGYDRSDRVYFINACERIINSLLMKEAIGVSKLIFDIGRVATGAVVSQNL